MAALTDQELRASVAKDKEAVRLLDCAASYVERGWTQGTDAETGAGWPVAPHSKRAQCWCALGAIRAGLVRTGLVTLYQDAAGQLHVREMVPFVVAVYERALWATASAMVGSPPTHPAMYASVVTKWNDAVATSGAAVVRKLRAASSMLRARISERQAALEIVEAQS